MCVYVYGYGCVCRFVYRVRACGVHIYMCVCGVRIYMCVCERTCMYLLRHIFVFACIWVSISVSVCMNVCVRVSEIFTPSGWVIVRVCVYVYVRVCERYCAH